jgi:hypothetical protein
MRKMTNIERDQQQNVPPRLPYIKNRKHIGKPIWKPIPPNEQRVHNTLEPTNVIDQEVGPRCFPYGVSYWEHEFPRIHNNGDNDGPNNCE